MKIHWFSFSLIAVLTVIILDLKQNFHVNGVVTRYVLTPLCHQICCDFISIHCEVFLLLSDFFFSFASAWIRLNFCLFRNHWHHQCRILAIRSLVGPDYCVRRSGHFIQGLIHDDCLLWSIRVYSCRVYSNRTRTSPPLIFHIECYPPVRKGQ